MSIFRYYQDFVGLNFFIQQPNGWYPPEQYYMSGSLQDSASGDVYYGQEKIHSISAGGILGFPQHCDVGDPCRIPTAKVRPLQNHLGGALMMMTGNVSSAAGEFQTVSDQPMPGFRYINFKVLRQRSTEVLKPWYWHPSIATDAFNMLMTYRNGPYGYPSWKQIRVGQNPLTRKQILHNIFTYVEEPGITNKFQSDRGVTYQNTNRFGPIKAFREPVVSAPSKPLSLQGGVNVYNQRTDSYNLKIIQLQTTFGNETLFFANDEINRYYETIEETDENYENFKELYLDDGLESDSSPFDQFNLMIYGQTVWPKVVNSFINKTRSRTHFVNKFWRDQRYLRSASSASSFGAIIENQSIWPLDARFELATTGALSYPKDQAYSGLGTFVWPYPLGGSPTGSDPDTPNLYAWNYGTGVRPPEDSVNYAGFTTGSFRGGAGVLQNTYSQLHVGMFVGGELWTLANLYGAFFGNFEITQMMTASCFYSRLHTLNHYDITCFLPLA